MAILMKARLPLPSIPARLQLLLRHPPLPRRPQVRPQRRPIPTTPAMEEHPSGPPSLSRLPRWSSASVVALAWAAVVRRPLLWEECAAPYKTSRRDTIMNFDNVMRICLGTLASSVVFHRGCQGAAKERATQASPPPIIRRPRPYGI